MATWQVVAEPKGQNPGSVERKRAGLIDKARAALSGQQAESGETEVVPENTGGMVIYVTNGTTKQEVSRVAWIRREGVCRNPDVPFDKQFRQELDKARAAVKALNDMMGDGSLQ